MANSNLVAIVDTSDNLSKYHGRIPFVKSASLCHFFVQLAAITQLLDRVDALSFFEVLVELAHVGMVLTVVLQVVY